MSVRTVGTEGLEKPEFKDDSSVQILSGVVVRVDLSTELASGKKTAAHDFICLVVGHVELEEARVGLGESGLVHVLHQSDLMFSADAGKIYGQTTAAPNELEVVSSFNFIEALKDAPESCNDRVVGCAVVGGD